MCGTFEISIKEGAERLTPSVLIPPNLKFRIKTQRDELAFFIHIDPYSEIGLKLLGNDKTIYLSKDWCHDFKNAIEELYLGEVEIHDVDAFIYQIVKSIPEEYYSSKNIDPRIMECIKLIKNSNPINLSELSSTLSLSQSRLSHLFKEETSITLKQYVQHRKMVKAIDGIHKDLSLTEAAYYGGFSDQPHFNNVFKKMFGIKPSKTKQ